MPKISVIIPVYNVEKYLEKALDSIINQTFTDFEAICIDDKSTDSSLEILKEFAQKDSRIKIIEHKENQGQSAARNHALDVATGEYIIFIDPDDWVELNMFEEIYKTFLKTNSDSIWFNNYRFDDNTKNQIILFDETHILNHDGYYDITPDNILYFSDYVWNKAFKKSFLQQKNIRFPEGLIFEDCEFYFKCFTQCKKIYYINKPFYYYRVREGSSVTKGRQGDLNVKDIFSIFMNVHNYIVKNGLFQEYKNVLLKLFGQNFKSVLIPNQHDKVIRYANEVLEQINFPEAFK